MRFVSMLIAGGLALGPGPFSPVAAAADASADIPGIDLPGPVAAGRLGGAIYDVVYHVSVPAGYVIVASLTGTAGTDFDLYLFDSSATTVLSDTGLLTKSIGSTSTESISWPSRAGGTYYLDLNGATNLEGDYRLAVQTVPDPTPPVVSAVLADGRASTNQLTVPVALTASDDLSGVSEMAFSDDGSTYSDWRPFSRSTSWTFEPGDGSRTLWVKVKNGVGLESAPATAKVTIDTVKPSVLAIDPAPGITVVGLRPVFRVTFDEPIDAATWTSLGLIVQSASGELVAGSYGYSATTRTGTFVPTADLIPGVTYVVTFGDVTDVAGNRVAAGGSWTVVPLAPVDLQVGPATRIVASGATVSFDLSLIGAPAPVSIHALESPGRTGTFTPLDTVELVNGRGSLVVTPDVSTTYRFSYAGAFGFGAASVDVQVLVRRSVVLVGRVATTTARARVGAPVKLVAAIGPTAAGVPVSFRIYRFDTTRRRWVYAGSQGRRTDPAGRATVTWTPAKAGSYYWRVAASSTPEFANGISPVYRWSVR